MPVRSNRYFQVIATYVRRPVFRALAIVPAIFFGMELGYRRGIWWRYDSMFAEFVGVGLGFLPVPFLIALIAALLAHVRAELDNPRGAVVPKYVVPHLAIAGAVFAGVCVAAVFWVYETGYNCTWPPGVLAVVLSLMTVSAWASIFRASWFSLLLVPVFLFMLLANSEMRFVLEHLMDRGIVRGYPGGTFDLHLRFIPYLTAALLFVDVAILAMLGRHLARLSSATSDQSFAQRLWRVASGAIDVLQLPKPSTTAKPHRMIHGLLRRAWHRRVPAITPGAPWWMAAAIAGLISLFYLLFGDELLQGGHRSYSAEISIPVIFATIIPAVAVAITWRERYNSFGYESLFPVRRQAFSIELALAMAVDLTEYWLAAILATLFPQVCLSIAVFNGNAFSLQAQAPPIVASAMMQFLSLGAIFWISRQRSFMAVGSAIIALLLATTIPFQLSWEEPHPISAASLLMIAAIEMACGLALTAAGYVAWKTGELA